MKGEKPNIIPRHNAKEVSVRGKTFCVLGIGFILGLCLLAPPAQCEEQEVEMFLVEEIVLNPSGAEVYEEAIKEMIGLYTEHSLGYSVSCFIRDDFHYYFSFPIKNYGDIDNIYKQWYAFLEKWGMENYQAMMKKLEGTYESIGMSVIRLMPEMSYVPENPRLSPDEALFRLWGSCYVKPGKEKEVAENFKKIAAMWKEKGITTGWETYAIEMGTDMPVYFYSEIGNSAADFWNESDKIHEIIGEDITNLWMKTLKLFRKYEYHTGWYRPDLSYVPKKE